MTDIKRTRGLKMGKVKAIITIIEGLDVTEALGILERVKMEIYASCIKLKEIKNDSKFKQK